MIIRLNVHAANIVSQLPPVAVAAIFAMNPAVSVRVAGRLTKRSGHVVRTALANGSLTAIGEPTAPFIRLNDLSAWAGRTFSPSDLRAAGDRPRRNLSETPRPIPTGQRQQLRNAAPNV